MMKITVEQLAQRLGAELAGDGSGYITAVGTVEAAGADRVTFITDKRKLSGLKESQAGAVIVDKHIEGLSMPQLIVKNVDSALINALGVFAPKLTPIPEGIHPTAVVANNAKIGKGTSVGPCVIIEYGAEIGENSVIAGGCKIGESTKIGKNSQLDYNVVVYHNCSIGNNVIIQANCTIGSTGFGYAHIEGEHKLIPHNGTVIIENFVEIGANSCVDRAKFGETRIGAGTKIDNLVQIAHNVQIGKYCLVAGQVGIAGNCKIGDGVVFGGQAGASDNIKIGDGAMIGGASAIFQDCGPGKMLFGTPAIETKLAFRVIPLTKRLPKLAEQLKQLRARVKELEAANDDKK